MAYWTNALNQGASLDQIGADWMTSQIEVKTRYLGLNSDQFVSAIYQGVLGRVPDAAGLAYWRPLIEAGTIPRDTFVSSIIAGAKAPTGGGWDAALLSNRADIGLKFANMNVPANAGTLAADVIKLATADPATVSLAQSVLNLIPAAANSTQAATSIANLATLISNVASTVGSQPGSISGLNTYVSEVGGQITSNPSANIADVINAAATVATNVASNTALLNNPASLAQTTVTAPSTITPIMTPPSPGGGGGGGGGGGPTSDTTAPVFVSAATSADGTKVIMTYDGALNATTAAAGAFDVQVAGSGNVVTAVAVSGSTVELTLTTPVTNGQVVTVGYTDPTAGDDANAIQDAAGNDALSLVAQSVQNSSTAEAPLFTVTVNSGVIEFSGTATGAITVTESSGTLTFTRNGNEASTKPEITALNNATGIPAGFDVTVSETLFSSLKEKFANNAAVISGQVSDPTNWSTHINRIKDGGISDAAFDPNEFMQVYTGAAKFADASITVSAAGNFDQFTTAVLGNLGKFKADGVEGLTLTEVQYNQIIGASQLAKLKDGAATLDNGSGGGLTALDAGIVTTIVGNPTAVAKLKDGGVVSLVNLNAAQFATLSSKLWGDGGGVAVVDLTGAMVEQLVALSNGITKVRSEGLSNLANLDLGNASISNTVITNLFSKVSSGAGVTVIATGAAEDEITTLLAAVKANKVGAQNGGITGDLAVTNANFSDASDVTALFGQYNGNTATVVATSMDAGKLNSLASDEAKIATNGITGNLVIAADNLNPGNIAKLFAKYGGTSATVDLGNSNLAKLTEVAGGIAKISAGGITGSTQFGPIDSTLSTDAITGLLGVAMNDSAAVYVNATAMDAAQLTAVGTGIGKVDSLTIDSTHGVSATAANITGKTLALTGAVTATDLLTVTGTAGGDTTDLSNITTTNSSVVYVGAAGADAVTFKATSSSVLAQATAADSGTYTATTVGVNTHSTVGFDVVTGLGAGDAVKLSAAYSGVAGAANGLVAVAVTGNTLDSNTLTLADNSVHMIRGTYTGGATDTFVGDAGGADALLIYDADAVETTAAYEAVVIVGGGTLTATGGDFGLITFA